MTVSNSSYKKLIGTIDYTLKLSDSQIDSHDYIRLVCDTTKGSVTIRLPKISDFGANFDKRIVVIDANNNASKNKISIISPDGILLEGKDKTPYEITKDGGMVEVVISTRINYSIIPNTKISV